jgi:hypothetical protein
MNKCITCGKEIASTKTVKRNNSIEYEVGVSFKKYCSLKCRTKDYYKKYYTQFEWQEEKVCPRCGKLFKQKHINQKFCSSLCRRLQWKHKKVIESHKPTTCPYCEKVFIPKTLQQQFCSNKCMSNHHNKEKGINVGYGGTEHICLICKKTFPAKTTAQKYCSKKCRRRADYENNTENKLHHGRLRRVLKKKLGGTYTLKQWNNLVKECGGICKVCGQKQKMTVDHVIPLSKWEEWAKKHNPSYQANDIENIQPLCLSCNIRKSNKI